MEHSIVIKIPDGTFNCQLFRTFNQNVFIKRFHIACDSWVRVLQFTKHVIITRWTAGQKCLLQVELIKCDVPEHRILYSNTRSDKKSTVQENLIKMDCSFIPRNAIVSSDFVYNCLFKQIIMAINNNARLFKQIFSKNNESTIEITLNYVMFFFCLGKWVKS